ncbi:hypothetical protein [Deinococcus sp. S9]|uniref:hypothetical protein n=1 Tax=Deinococcus sp. S9 TaxID=2545754 RepID=UPI001055BFDF|nr:hypothetical protein [Deinococcus sp. S9]TDE84804.1 hypothetical protein E0686_15160 [Deinococcus sp. S9]
MRNPGYVLLTTLLGLVLLTLLAAIYLTTSLNSPRTARANADSLAGFLAAEGGLNMRAALIREKFIGFERPSGTSPGDPATACRGTALGSGDFACQRYSLGGRAVMTFVRETTRNPDGDSGTVAEGERYAGLGFQQYSYRVNSEATLGAEREATVQMEFQSRLVPLFQFAAFYAQDLEINPGPDMTLNGRVHTNGNLYLSPEAKLRITGKVSAQGSIYRTRKDRAGCSSGAGTVQFGDSAPLGCLGGALSDTQLSAYQGQVLAGQPGLTVPSMGSLDPDPTGSLGNELWAKADLRIVARKSALSPTGFVLLVQDARGVTDGAATAALSSCALSSSAITFNSSFYDAREGRNIQMMNVNQQQLMNCLQGSAAFRDAAGNRLTVGDTTNGGLALHFSFDPPGGQYGVRLTNAATLGTSGGVQPQGLTIATNQPLYVQGDYNANGKVPASLLADAINILSNAWQDTDKTASTPSVSTAALKASPTTVNAAFLAGIVPTQGSSYSGGLENYPRFHENWTGVTFTYTGSFVSLGPSRYGVGRWAGGGNRYEAPTRNWAFDESFRNAGQLPPLTPRFVYLRQLFFARDF